MFNIFSRDNAIYGEAVLYSNFTFFFTHLSQWQSLYLEFHY